MKGVFCREASRVLSHFFPSSAEGIGANQNWIVNIGEQDSETSLSTTSYLPPVISDFIAGTSNAVTNLQTDGSDPVFVSTVKALLLLICSISFVGMVGQIRRKKYVFFWFNSSLHAY